MATHTDQTPSERLAAIVAAGQAAYEARFAPALPSPTEAIEPGLNIYLSDERQREICLACPLADCLDITDRRCPIRVEQRRIWREQSHKRVSQ